MRNPIEESALEALKMLDDQIAGRSGGRSTSCS